MAMITMETLSPESSPTLSITPPHASISSTFALPPIKTLPTWNRPQFKDGKFARSVVKNTNIQVELIGRIEKIERCTQTSISPLDSVKTLKISPSTESHGSTDRLRKSFDKRIVFLESNQKEVLSNLHKELEKLKIQNKALKFQLVMAGDRVPQIYPTELLNGSTNDNGEEIHSWKTFDTQSPHNDHHLIEKQLLREEIKELKKLLQEADAKNIYLTKLVEQLKQKASASRLHSGHHKPKQSHKNDYSAQGKKDAHSQQASAKYAGKQNRQEIDNSGHDHSMIQGLKQLTGCQQNELLLLKEKLQEHVEKQMENAVIFPKLEPTNRSVLVHANSTNVDETCKGIREHISLPSLPGFPAKRNMTLRQKRAQALHVQRQRSNRNMTLTAATK